MQTTHDSRAQATSRGTDSRLWKSMGWEEVSRERKQVTKKALETVQDLASESLRAGWGGGSGMITKSQCLQ